MSYFIGKSHFEDDGTQNYVVFQSLFRYFKLNVKTDTISSSKSNGLSGETIEVPSTSNIGPIADFCGGGKLRVKLVGGYLKQLKVSNIQKTIVNIYIVYELGVSSSHNNDPTLKNCFFGAVTFTKNADIDKYGYSGYGTGFDRRSSFSFSSTRFGQNVVLE